MKLLGLLCCQALGDQLEPAGYKAILSHQVEERAQNPDESNTIIKQLNETDVLIRQKF